MNTSGSIAKGEIMAAMPITPKKLKKFEPMTVPSAMSVLFFRADAIDAASSGSDVPMATIVSPMISSETPKKRAISVAPQTNALELPSKTNSPPMVRIKDMSSDKSEISVSSVICASSFMS